MRFRAVRLVAARELREAARSRWFVLATASFLVLSLGLSFLGLAGAQRSGLAGFDRTTASLMNLAILFVPLLTLPLGGLALAGELEDGSLGMLLAQPVTRLEVYLGKYLGLLGSVAATILAGFGLSGLVVTVTAGGGNAVAFVSLVGILLALAAATMALGALVSVVTRSRARVVGAAFTLWLLLVYVSDLGTIGLALARNLRPHQIVLLTLLNPVAEARILGTLALSRRLDILGPAGVWCLDQFGLAGTASLFLGSLAATTAALLALGQGVFRKTVIA